MRTVTYLKGCDDGVACRHGADDVWCAVMCGVKVSRSEVERSEDDHAKPPDVIWSEGGGEWPES